MNYGYVRVSSKDQNEDRQMIALQQTGERFRDIFVDKQSGKNFDRRNYKRMMRTVGVGDVIFVKSIDRLGRNYEEIQEQWKIITKEKRIDIVVIDMPLLDTRAEKNLVGRFIADVVLQLLAFCAENERINIRQRQAEGIAAAKARGVRFGRPERIYTPEYWEAVERYSTEKLSCKEAAKIAGMPPSTFRYHRNKGLPVIRRTIHDSVMDT